MLRKDILDLDIRWEEKEAILKEHDINVSFDVRKFYAQFEMKDENIYMGLPKSIDDAYESILKISKTQYKGNLSLHVCVDHFNILPKDYVVQDVPEEECDCGEIPCLCECTVDDGYPECENRYGMSIGIDVIKSYSGASELKKAILSFVRETFYTCGRWMEPGFSSSCSRDRCDYVVSQLSKEYRVNI